MSYISTQAIKAKIGSTPYYLSKLTANQLTGLVKPAAELEEWESMSIEEKFQRDPNWGRIAMGIGKSGEIIDQKKLKIKIGNFVVAENGKISETYDEQKLKEYMQWGSIEIEVNLKQGNDTFTCYTCDFTHDYIDINADYRN